jgi:hypothetical protein
MPDLVAADEVQVCTCRPSEKASERHRPVCTFCNVKASDAFQCRRPVRPVLEANRVVTVQQLLERVWPEQLPYRARQVLRNYLSRLRRLSPRDNYRPAPGGASTHRGPTAGNRSRAVMVWAMGCRAHRGGEPVHVIARVAVRSWGR